VKNYLSEVLHVILLKSRHYSEISNYWKRLCRNTRSSPLGMKYVYIRQT